MSIKIVDVHKNLGRLMIIFDTNILGRGEILLKDQNAIIMKYERHILEYEDFKNRLEETVEPGELTESKLKNLENFLTALEYTKEKLVSIFEPRTILKEDDWEKVQSGDWGEMGFKLSWGALINILINLFGRNQFISLIADNISIKFDKTISQGQAEALLKRILEVNLTSTGRTQLYELRKKIRKYEKLVTFFGEWTQTYDFKFKILIMGLNHDQSSKLLQKPAYPEFRDQRAVLGFQFYLKNLEISNKKVQLGLWDISLGEEYESFTQKTPEKSYIYRISIGANGVIIAFDKSKRETLTLAEEAYSKLKKTTGLKFEINEKTDSYVYDYDIEIPIILVGLGNGTQITSEEGQLLANSIGAQEYVELSDMNSQAFKNVISTLTLGIVTNYKQALNKQTRSLRFKIAVVGDVRVGKTSLIKKFTTGSFSKYYIKTIGTQFSKYDREVEGTRLKCLFYDIAGGDSFFFIHQPSIKNSKAAIIVYNIGEEKEERDKLSRISYWYKRIKRFAGDIPIFLIANKADLVDQTKIDNSTIQEFVKKNNLLGYYLTSAKSGKGIPNVFNLIIENLYDKFQPVKYRLKIAVVGDGGIGKSSLLKRYTKTAFKLDFIETIGAQFSIYDKIIEKQKVRTIFWDIAGGHYLKYNFYKKSKAAIIVYSLKENKLGKQSFNHIMEWYAEIKNYCGDIPIYVFANNVDSVDEKNLDTTELQKTVKETSMQGYYMTSAKTGKGVSEAFDSIIENVFNRFK
jgi:small GTP-binding protein